MELVRKYSYGVEKSLIKYSINVSKNTIEYSLLLTFIGSRSCSHAHQITLLPKNHIEKASQGLKVV